MAQEQLYAIYFQRNLDIENEYNEKLLQKSIEANEVREANIIDANERFAALSRTAKENEIAELEKNLLKQQQIIGGETEKAQEAQNQLYEIYLSEKQEIIDKYNNKEIASNNAKVQQIISQEEMLLRQRTQYADFTLDVAKNTFHSLAKLMEIAGKENKEFSMMLKGIAIAQSIIDTMVSAQSTYKAFTQSIPGIPGVIAGAAAATGVTIEGAARTAVIAAQKFADGGIAGSGIVAGNSFSGDKVPVYADSGEMFINRQDQRNLFSLIKGAFSVGDVGNNNNFNKQPLVVNLTINGNTTEETIDDMITKLQNVVNAANYRGIDLMAGIA